LPVKFCRLARALAGSGLRRLTRRDLDPKMGSSFIVAKMPQSNLHLKRVFCDAFRQLDRGGKRLQADLAAIEVRFYPYAGVHHTIRLRAGRVFVRLSDLFQAAPPEVIRALAFLLVARLLSSAPRPGAYLSLVCF